MSIFKSRAAEVEKKLTGRILSLERDLRRARFEMQANVAVNSGDDVSYAYSYNNYREYAKACQAVSDKYENRASWGSGLTANIIDFRAAVTVSSGPQYKPQKKAAIQQKDEEGKSIGGEEDANDDGVIDPAEREMEFCRSLFEHNDLDHETPQAWGREAEIEGRCAVTLDWDDNEKQVLLVHRPWLTYRYEEERDEKDPRVIKKITWAANTAAKIKAGSAEGDLLVCRRFSGRESAKYPMTKVIRCLTEIESISQAFRDWREINRLYAAPVPDFEFKTAEEAEDFRDSFDGKNWKIKKALIHAGVFQYKGPDMTGITSLEGEIKRLACFISGTTGYPLQFLLPDMLSNRSTSENIMESALIHTASERAIWTGFYEELISKAMTLWKAKTGKTALDPNRISISISLMTKEQWERLTTFWLPAFREDLVTREAVLPMIPDFNVREELDRREKADSSEVARITQELDRVEKEQAMAGQQQNPPPEQKPPVSGQFKKKTPDGEEEEE